MKAPTVNNLWDVLLLSVIENFRVDAQSSEQAYFPLNQVLITLFIDTSWHKLSAMASLQQCLSYEVTE